MFGLGGTKVFTKNILFKATKIGVLTDSSTGGICAGYATTILETGSYIVGATAAIRRGTRSVLTRTRRVGRSHTTGRTRTICRTRRTRRARARRRGANTRSFGRRRIWVSVGFVMGRRVGNHLHVRIIRGEVACARTSALS